MPDRELTNALLAVVRQRMDEQWLSGRALAECAEVDWSTLARKLRGTGDLSVDDLDRIAVVLGARDVIPNDDGRAVDIFTRAVWGA